MAQSYTRQSSMSDGDTITAALFNDEYNQLVNAFTYSSSSASSTGHRHDGTAGHGGNIHTIGDLDFLNKIVADSTNNRWGFFVEVSSAAVEQIRIQDGAIVPVTDNDIDLGTSSLEFKDAYFDGTVTTDLLTVSGTTNLDGAIQVDNTITVGVDDTGYDVKFFGDTASAYMLWDTSADDLVLAGAAGLDVAGDIDVDGTSNLDNTDIDGTLAVDGTTISLDATTSLNIDNSNTSNGITIGTATSGVPVSIGHTTSEVTVNDNLTVTGTLTLGSGAELTEAELEMLDGITAGTVAASKAVVVDSNKDAASFRNITLTGELDAATLDISGDADIDGTLEADAYTVDGTALNEYIADTVGAMVSSNTESGITVAYEDGDNTLDFTVGTLNQDTTGTADNITISANNSTDETVYPIFVDGATGSQGAESDTGFTYNPSSGLLTISGELDAGSLDISGNADIDGTLEADAITVDGTALNEYIADTVGAMVSSNTETNITVTYEDGDNTLDFVIGTLNQDTTGNAATFTATANNSTDETVYPVFVDGATGSQGAETDTGFTYNPSSGLLTISGELDAGSLDISGNADIDGTLEADAITVNGTALSSVIAGTTVTLASTVTVSDSTANTNFPVVFHDESNALLDDTGALRYNPSTGELLVPKLTVAGTTTTADTVTMQASNAIIFEGATADSNETTLSIVDPTSDHTQYLINQGGYIPVLAAATTTQISSTPAELNLLDGSTANTVVNSKAVIYGSSGELAGTLSTAAQTNVTSLGTLTTLTVDDITINGSTISDGGDLTVDVTGVLNLDATTQIILKDDGTNYGTFYQTSNDFYIQSLVQDKDIVFYGNDGGSGITALTLDMSSAGAATFNSSVNATNYLVGGAQGSDGQVLTSTGSGVAWEDAGSGGASNVNGLSDAKTFGTASIMIGDATTGTISSADNNTGVGIDIFAALTTGDNNTTVGFQGLGANTTGSANSAFGTYALDANTTGDSNTAIGYGTLSASQTASNNTAVGRNALLVNTSGADNTAVGAYALDANTSGTYNTAIGYNALTGNVDGSRITAVGYGSLAAHDPSSATDTYNTAIGFHALNANTTASNNTAVGGNALAVNTTGTVNVAVGTNALAANTTASSNTAVGHNALTANTTGSGNVAVGKDAGEAVTTATYSTLVGYLAGTNLTTGNDNTAFGSEALRDVSTGASNTAVGSEALVVNAADNNTAVGMDALKANSTGAGNTAVGKDALVANTTASNNTAVGFDSLTANTTGASNNALGYASLYANTTGGNNVAIGNSAMESNTTASNNTAVGKSALYANTTGSENTAVGVYALDANTTGEDNTAVGYNSLTANTTGNYNTAVGYGSAEATTTGSTNTSVGYNSLEANTTGSSNVAVGKDALATNSSADNNTAVGKQALMVNTTGSENVAVGAQALDANTTGANNTAVGKDALTASTTAADNTAVGYGALAATNNTRNLGIGYRALTAQSGTSDNIAIGYDALVRQTTGANGNLAIGNYAGRAVVSSASTSQLIAIGQNVADSNTGALAGYQNTFIGYNIASTANIAGAFQNTAIGGSTLTNLSSGDDNVALGKGAGPDITSASGNICIGVDAGDAVTTGGNNIFIGKSTTADGGSHDTAIVIGYNSTSKGNATGFMNAGSGGNYAGNNSSAWSTTSDRRIKKNIEDNNTGLDKINQVRVRNFEYRLPEEVDSELSQSAAINKEGTQLGVIAQEVMEVLPDIVDQESTGCYSVNPDNMTWYLVNAVKELSAKVEELEEKLK